MDPELQQKRKKRSRIRKVKKRELGKVNNSIDVTPMVNVGLILLIIFMVITPMLSRGMQVPMPQTRYHAAPQDSNQPIVVMDARENLYVDRDPVANYEEMQQRVMEEWESMEMPTRTVYLKVPPTVNYGAVYPLMMALHEIGVLNVELGTEELRAR
jgi:biopolymer transport protein TolR